MKFTGWRPDQPDYVDVGPAVDLDEARNMFPTMRGYRTMPTPVSRGSALPAQCLGAAVVQKLNGTRRVFAGTTTAIYEFDGSTWSDVATPVYTATTSQRYIFAQFGDATIATNDADQLQAATTGNFAAIANSPKARIVFSVPNFVIALNTQDGSGSTAFGDGPDRWWCSGFQDHTAWTPALSTQCASGRLIGGGGEITAGAKFGNGFVVYKEREMWLATYVGTPFVFNFQQIPGDVGCVGPEAVVDIGGAHVFVGSDNVWLFDGTRPVSIADGKVRDSFFNSSVSLANLSRTRITFDRDRMLIWITFPESGDATGINSAAICYHLQTGEWGTGAVGGQALLNYVEPGVTWANVASTYPTWDDLSAVQWDSSAWFPSGRSLAYFDTSNQLYTTTGSDIALGNWLLSTKPFGLPFQDSVISRVRLRGLTASPPNGDVEITVLTVNTNGDLQSSTTVTMQYGDARINAVGSYHVLSFNMTGICIVHGVDVEIKPAGAR